MRLTESDAGRTIDVKSGETIEIALPENRTTGYRWGVESIDQTVCAIVADEFRAPAQPVPGASGTHLWQFKALRAGQCDIALAYRRAWETDAAAARAFKLVLRVTP